MFGIASGLIVEIGVIASGGRAFDWFVFFLLSELLKTVVHLLAHEITLLDPALDASLGAHPSETALAIEHLDPIPIFSYANFVVNLRELIAKRDLGRGNVINFEHAPVPATAGG